MYAIIATGGKQYKVTAGEALQIEKIKAAVGTEVEFDQVLMLVDGEKIESVKFIPFDVYKDVQYPKITVYRK